MVVGGVKRSEDGGDAVVWVCLGRAGSYSVLGTLGGGRGGLC